MSEEYYVKYKGRLQGPFTVKQLKSGLESGKLSRSHLASIDRRNWVPLGEVEGVCEPEHIEEVVEEIAAEVEEEVAIPPTQQQTGDVYSQQQPGMYPQQQQGMYPQQQQESSLLPTTQLVSKKKSKTKSIVIIAIIAIVLFSCILGILLPLFFIMLST